MTAPTSPKTHRRNNTSPAASGRDAAAHFDVTPVWISIVKHSPVFRAEFDRRRERISVAVEVDIVDRATALAELSLNVLSARIEQSGDTMPLRALIDTTAMALKALGFGPGKTPSPVSVQVNVADPKLMERALEPAEAAQPGAR